jgi:hypothetical protein
MNKVAFCSSLKNNFENVFRWSGLIPITRCLSTLILSELKHLYRIILEKVERVSNSVEIDSMSSTHTNGQIAAQANYVYLVQHNSS